MVVEAEKRSNLDTTGLNPDEIFFPGSVALSPFGMKIQRILILNALVSTHNPAFPKEGGIGMRNERCNEVALDIKEKCGESGIDQNSLRELDSQFRNLVKQRESLLQR